MWDAKYCRNAVEKIYEHIAKRFCKQQKKVSKSKTIYNRNVYIVIRIYINYFSLDCVILHALSTV